MCIVVNKALFARVYLCQSLEITLKFFFGLNHTLQPDKKLNLEHANFDKLHFLFAIILLY